MPRTVKSDHCSYNLKPTEPTVLANSYHWLSHIIFNTPPQAGTPTGIDSESLRPILVNTSINRTSEPDRHQTFDHVIWDPLAVVIQKHLSSLLSSCDANDFPTLGIKNCADP